MNDPESVSSATARVERTWNQARIQAPMAREALVSQREGRREAPLALGDFDLDEFFQARTTTPPAPPTPPMPPAATVARSAVVPTNPAAPPPNPPGAQTVPAELRRLVQASIEAAEQRARSRLDSMDERLLKVTAHVGELRGQVAAVDGRLSALESRISSLEALPTVVEDLVTSHVDRLGAQLAGLPNDVEGVYRELDAVAEVMATRTASISQSLDRLGPLESAVLEVRHELGRAVESVQSARSDHSRTQDQRIEDLQRRIDFLESPGVDLERLHQALGRVVCTPGWEQLKAGPRPNGATNGGGRSAGAAAASGLSLGP